VEVLTGGASAVYGSDAVAGVVNFIMNDSFEGIHFVYNNQWYNHQQHDGQVSSIVSQRAQTNPAQFQVPDDIGKDGTIQDYSMLLGSNFANGKGNATLFFEYRKTDPVTQATRDFSSCTLGSDANGFNCGGSSTSVPGRFTNNNQSTPTANRSFTIANTAGDVRPFVAANDQFNFAPYNYYQRPDERYLFNAFAHYDALPNVRVYTEFDFSDDKTTSKNELSVVLFDNKCTILNNNPLLSQSFKQRWHHRHDARRRDHRRRNQEGGGRQETCVHTDYRYVIGAKGDFLDHKWDYDFVAIRQGHLSETYLNDFSKTRTTRALNVVTDPATGERLRIGLDGTDRIACRTTSST
jgi:outer membrane receptor protein involved in Fe transport